MSELQVADPAEQYFEILCSTSKQFAMQLHGMRFKPQQQGIVCITAVVEGTDTDGTKFYIPALSAIDQHQLNALILFLEQQRVPN